MGRCCDPVGPWSAVASRSDHKGTNNLTTGAGEPGSIPQSMEPPDDRSAAVTKRYGTTLAVDDFTFTVRPGHVTGFLGPNGAGKSTTMRMVLGLDHPTSGQALVLGRPYQDLPAPLRSVGALLDARQVHPRRSAPGSSALFGRHPR